MTKEKEELKAADAALRATTEAANVAIKAADAARDDYRVALDAWNALGGYAKAGAMNNKKELNKELGRAVFSGKLEEVKELIEAGADVNCEAKKGVSSLISASVHGDIEIVKLLLKVGADVNAETKDGCTALMWASSWHHPETVKLLLASGADVNVVDKYGRTALSMASRDEVVKLLENNKQKRRKNKGK